MFPSSIVGTVAPPQGMRIDAASLIDGVRDRIEDQGATQVALDGSTLHFRVPFWRFASYWNLLLLLDGGVVSVSSSGELHYRFSCRRMLIISIAGILLLGSAAVTDGKLELVDGASLLAGWLWIFGIPYLIAAGRLSRFVHEYMRTSTLPA